MFSFYKDLNHIYMVIIKIKAGLGNQMFQYAFGRALSLERKEPLFLDASYYIDQPKLDAKRDFALEKFNIQATILPNEEIKKYNPYYKILLRKIYNRIKKSDVSVAYKYDSELIKSKDAYYEGYWLNQKYFNWVFFLFSEKI